MKKKESIIQYKLLYTAIIFLIYMIGREIPLYGVDIDAYRQMKLSASNLLMQTVGGDIFQYSLFALGFSPYMISMMVVQMITIYRKAVLKVRVSMVKASRATAIMTLILALLQSYLRTKGLIFKSYDNYQILIAVQIIAVLEMVAGVMVVMWICERNKRYGLGGQTALILVNILDGMIKTLADKQSNSLILPVCISVIFIPVMIVMENAEKRIPVQRVSIHNIYADKNYIAIKLNPIGVMPIMFSTAFFMLPQLMINGLLLVFPDSENLLWWKDNMVLDRPLGISFYIGIIFFLTIMFSMIMLSPGDLAEQLLKGGDSIVNVHAGRDTKRYLRKSVIRISIFSSFILGICVGVPLVMQLYGTIESSLVMFPTSVMMLTGLWCNSIREFRAIKSFDDYKPFI